MHKPNTNLNKTHHKDQRNRLINDKSRQLPTSKVSVKICKTLQWFGRAHLQNCCSFGKKEKEKGLWELLVEICFVVAHAWYPNAPLACNHGNFGKWACETPARNVKQHIHLLYIWHARPSEQGEKIRWSSEEDISQKECLSKQARLPFSYASCCNPVQETSSFGPSKDFIIERKLKVLYYSNV